MSVLICKSELCTGCSLCAEVCPLGAIEISKDDCGFALPVIDGEKCVECGACQKKCPVNNGYENGSTNVYAAFAKDKDIRNRSSSGGIFRLLADATLAKGGAVAAVGYDEEFHAVYKIAEKPDELDELMGSKYTEALSDGIYGKVKRLLDGGRKVLFVGTPCRAAAMKNLVGENEDLLTVDFICHGVPTSLLLEKYLEENFLSVKNVYFRDKTHGWQEFSMRVDTENGKPYIRSQYKDPYLRVFLGNGALRESCYGCRFKGDSYASDITLGDFWGISSCIPSMNDDGGTSAVVIRTEKGSSAFAEIKDALNSKQTTADALGKANAALLVSSPKNASREKMLSMLKGGKSFSAIAEEFGRPAPAKVILSERLKRTVKKILGKIKK